MKNPCWFCTFTLLVSLAMVFFLSGCKTSPPSAPTDNPPTAAIASHSAGKVVHGTDTVYVNVADDHGVTKVELYANNQLVATDNSSPWILIWDTEQWTDGACTLVATAYDAASHSTNSASVAVTIYNAFPVTFINPVYTPIIVTVYKSSSSSETRTIAVNDSTTFTLPTNPRSLVYSATTSGQTTSGTQIGLLLSFQQTGIDVSNVTYYRSRFVVPYTYFFMYMVNTGKSTLGPIYVNYGLTDQRRDDITIPTDGLLYQTGYYKAYTNTEVRAYWNSPYNGYSYWDQGSNFTFQWVENQSVTLTNAFPSAKLGTASFGQSSELPISGVPLQVPQVAKSVTSSIQSDGAAIAVLHE